MGRSSSSNSRSTSDDSTNLESLPLYSDLTIASPAELTAPNDTASPDEVRSFLVQLLVQNRKLHPDHARRIASKWNLGTGRELLSYTPSLYAEIFGLEDAWMVYKEAKVFILTQRKKGKPKVRWILFSILLVLFSVSLMVCIVISLDDHPDVKVISGFASAGAGLLWVVSVIAILDIKTVEKQIEDELAAGLAKV